MTDPIPAEAVETAARAYIESGLPNVPRRAGRHYHAMHAALTAAAPLIAAQAARHERERTATAIARLIRARANATLDDRERLSGNISAGYALVFAGIWHKNALLSDDPVAAELTDLRAGIEALRDEWRAEAATAERNGRALDRQSMYDGARAESLYAMTMQRHADALGSLLGGAANV